MKKVILALSVLILLCGCGLDLSDYEKIELNDTNAAKYIRIQKIDSNNTSNDISMTYKTYARTYGTYFEDVSFDVVVNGCYIYHIEEENYDDFYEMFSINSTNVTLEASGFSTFNGNVTTDKEIYQVCTSENPRAVITNVKGFVYIPNK